MLYDKEFLLKLDKQKNKTIYARITALTFQETPIEYIEGRVTQGSINLDGASAVRRSCSLTIVAQDFNYNDYYWGLNTKFKLEIGVENTIDSNYPDIIWFKQGIYLITSFNTSRNATSFNIQIQGKDKMCLLNGEVGGVLESSVDFGILESEDKYGNWTRTKIPIQEIIKNMVHIYGGEPYHNIIINDLDMYGLELLEYRLDTPMYLYRQIDSETYTNVLFDSNKKCSVYPHPTYDKEGNLISKPALKTNIFLSELDFNDLEILTDDLLGKQPTNMVKIDGNNYFITKVEYGQTVGYRKTDLVYNDDLMANIGESIASVLDKIKAMLSEFEYFYNIEGQFVFQKKQSFKETMWTADQDKLSQSAQQGIARSSSYSYEFYGNELITAFNNNPNIQNLKNDYSIWGERESVSGAKIPIHLRYAIDKKPVAYKSIPIDYCTYKVDGDGNYIFDNNGEKIIDRKGKDFNIIDNYNKKYGTSLEGQDSILYDASVYDWREILYQMAKDHYKYSSIYDDFELKVAKANPDLYPTGRTGYEKYYIDIQGFWRDLYNPGLDDEVAFLQQKKDFFEKKVKNLEEKVFGKEVSYSESPIGGLENDLTLLNNFLREEGSTMSTLPDKYYQEELDPELHPEVTNSQRIYQYLKDSYPDIQLSDVPSKPNFTYNDALFEYVGIISEQYFRNKSQLDTDRLKLSDVLDKYNTEKQNYDENYYQSSVNNRAYWNKNVYEAPDLLNFWFDFLDLNGDINKYNVQTIGDRPKAINDNNIKSIYFRETPSVLFGEENLSGYKSIQIGGYDFDTLFTCSARGKSAKDKLDELIYQHGYCIDSATITTIPIYYLEPNTRIYIHDDKTGLDGDYIASKITIPLTYNGTMSITATKAAENIL